ncbi:MAG: TetR/AcrR family transcriptional regulator [Trebonia sp.]
MSAEQRRAMIVAATLPLVAEYGTAVTTGQIARAAGIGEGTIFRAFAGKEELLDACLAEAMNPGHVLRELASVPLDEPLATRLVQAAEALRAHLERMGTVIGALHASGHRRGQPRDGQSAPGDRDSSMKATREAVAELIEPDRAALRLEPEKLASIFLGLLFGNRPVAGEAEPQAADLVDVLLHGAQRDPRSTA